MKLLYRERLLNLTSVAARLVELLSLADFPGPTNCLCGLIQITRQAGQAPRQRAGLDGDLAFGAAEWFEDARKHFHVVAHAYDHRVRRKQVDVDIRRKIARTRFIGHLNLRSL